MLEGNLARPRGSPGKCWYANDNRNMWIGYAVGMLLHLGMTATRTTRVPETRSLKKESACDAVANYLCSLGSRELELSYGTVVSAWRSLRNDDGRLPLPWEAWEKPVPPPEKGQ